MGIGKREVRFQEGERELRLPDLLYANDLVLCDESEEGLRAIVRRFIEVYRRRGLKVNEGKSKVMVLVGEEGLECEVSVDVIRFKHVSEFKYFDVFWTNEVQMRQSVVGRWRVGGGFQVLLGLLIMLGVCSLSVLWSCMNHY